MGNVADGGLSRVFRTEFAGPSGSACCRTSLLGIGMLFSQTDWRRRYLVFAGGACERDGYSGAARAVHLGTVSSLGRANNRENPRGQATAALSGSSRG